MTKIIHSQASINLVQDPQKYQLKKSLALLSKVSLFFIQSKPLKQILCIPKTPNPGIFFFFSLSGKSFSEMKGVKMGNRGESEELVMGGQGGRGALQG